jgi:hypothetical protein
MLVGGIAEAVMRGGSSALGRKPDGRDGDQSDRRDHGGDIRCEVVVGRDEPAERVVVGFGAKRGGQDEQQHKREAEGEHERERLPGEQLELDPGQLAECAHHAATFFACALSSRYTSSRLAWSARRSAGTIPRATSSAATRAQHGTGAADLDTAVPLRDVADAGHAGEPRKVVLIGAEADANGLARARDQLSGCSGGYHAAAMENRDPIAELLGFVTVVGHEHHSGAALPDRADEVPGHATRGGVETLGHLVEEDDRGIVDEGASDEEPLALAGREARKGGLRLLRQAPLLEQHAPVDPAGRQRGEQIHGLPHPEPVRQRRLLQLRADPPTQGRHVLHRIEAKDADAPAVRPSKPLDRLDRRVFPDPFGPRMPKISPAAMSSETSSMATVCPYRLWRCSTSTTASPLMKPQPSLPGSCSRTSSSSCRGSDRCGRSLWCCSFAIVRGSALCCGGTPRRARST